MTEFRSTRRSLLALAACAALAFVDRCLGAAYDVAAYAFNASAAFGAYVLTSFMNIAPARSDELRPLERVKMTASESHALAVAKRERPVIFAGWRMSPST